MSKDWQLTQHTVNLPPPRGGHGPPKSVSFWTTTQGLPSGTVLSRIQPCRKNCFSDESCITWKDGKVIQDMILRLRNVECGEVEIQLQWIDLPGSKGLSL
uniref:Uncharacterized protein n=1 Tax=Kalanchoe fedtschenkoi TaxID=63787 RepID=A0A7N0VIG5_KALFE